IQNFPQKFSFKIFPPKLKFTLSLSASTIPKSNSLSRHFSAPHFSASITADEERTTASDCELGRHHEPTHRTPRQRQTTSYGDKGKTVEPRKRIGEQKSLAS
ncbi:hypothetical protein Dimus_029085, partial [Dionaea muscipula]